MKKGLNIIVVMLVILAFSTCKKMPDAPDFSNKIEFGTTKADTILYFNANISSEISQTRGNEIVDYGHCWSTDKKPSVDDNKTSFGKLNKPVTFKSEMENLTDNTTYYIRPYVTYSYGIVYGDEQSIKTKKTGKPVTATTAVSDITISSAKFASQIISDSGLAVTERGFCWNTDHEFTIDNCLDSVSVGAGLGNFEREVTSLNEGITYFVKSYAINDRGISYGEIKEFSTEPVTIPIVTTNAITEITISTAKSGGNVTSDGNATVTARGVCWNTAGNPTLENSIGDTDDGTGTGSFTSEIAGLTENTTYYVTAYVTNEKGTAYGTVITFTTLVLTLPTVTTDEISNITATSATGGGNVTSSGNGTVTVRGVCWNTTGNPTLENSIGDTDDGTGTGSFTSEIAGLTENTTYYVTAYVTNEKGTAYGQTKSFKTIHGFIDPRDGQQYAIVDIGNQTWIAENLKYLPSVSPSANGSDNDPYYYVYGYQGTNVSEAKATDNYQTYGVLYNWPAALNACPPGWHLPSDEEWKTMEMALGMSPGEADATGWRGTDEGKKMKSTGGWYNNGNGTNASGFNALPGGYRNSSGSFSYLGYNGYWWSSSETSGTHAWTRNLHYDGGQVYRNLNDKTLGFSVRCLKN